MKCLITAFCKITGIDPDEATALLGKQAEQVLDTMAIGASRFRGLHPQEIIDLSLGFGWAVTEIVVAPAIMKIMTGGDKNRPQLFPVYGEPIARFDFYMQNYVGIAIGTVGKGVSSIKHAVVNDRGVLSDPTGLWKSGDQINVEGLLILSKMHPVSLRLDQQADLAASMQAQGLLNDSSIGPIETDRTISSDSPINSGSPIKTDSPINSAESDGSNSPISSDKPIQQSVQPTQQSVQPTQQSVQPTQRSTIILP